MEIHRECLDICDNYWGPASRAASNCRAELGYSLLMTSAFDEGYTTAHVGFDLAVRNQGTSDGLSYIFTEEMVYASLNQDYWNRLL